MKQKTSEILELLKVIMCKNGLSEHNVEIVLHKNHGSCFTIAAYTSNYNLTKNSESIFYIGTEVDDIKINESSPCLWLASLLELGYIIDYVSLSFHCTLWSNYNDEYYEIEKYENCLNEYLHFCKYHHISAELLEMYCGEEFDDIVEQDYCEIVNGHVIIERFTVENCVFLFGHDELKETFAVYDLNKEDLTYDNEKVYYSYLGAFEDFQNRIKKYCYDAMKYINEKHFFTLGGDEELNKIIRK